MLAITDIDQEAANATAACFGIPRVCQSLDEVLDITQIEIIDIAVPAKHNLAVTEKAFEANKHVLVQKPMAEITTETVEMVETARKRRGKLAVNQQMRWSPAVRAASDVLRRRLLGELVHCSIDIDIRTRWDVWPWFSEHPYPELYYRSLHHVDTVRGWLRDPLQVYASLANHPHSGTKGPTRTYMIFKYPGDL